MAPQLLFYERAVPVSAARHRDVAIARHRDFRFACAATAVPVTTAELATASDEYAVVFVGEGEEVAMATILGVRDGENLFVDAEGRWQGRYVPAFVRRYPFVFAGGGEGERLTLCLDEACEAVNREGRGERLFDRAGERTSYLANLLDFMQRYQAALQRTRAFAKRVDELGLLRNVQAQLQLGDAGRIGLRGFRTVDRERLKALPTETVQELFAADGLEALYLHLASLRHLRRLGELAATRAGDAARVEGSGDAPLDGGDILLN